MLIQKHGAYVTGIQMLLKKISYVFYKGSSIIFMVNPFRNLGVNALIELKTSYQAESTPLARWGRKWAGSGNLSPNNSRSEYRGLCSNCKDWTLELLKCHNFPTNGLCRVRSSAAQMIPLWACVWKFLTAHISLAASGAASNLKPTIASS